MTTNPSDNENQSQSPTPPPPAWGTPADQEPASRPSGYGSEPGPSGPVGYGPGPGSQPTPGAGFFDAVRRLNVVRPDQGRVFAGVCAGLAQRWGVSPVAVRVLFVLVSLIFGAGLFLYGLLWMLLPQPDGRIHAQQVLRGQVTAGFVGALLAIVAGLPLGGIESFQGWVGILLVGVIIWLVVSRRRSSASP